MEPELLLPKVDSFDGVDWNTHGGMTLMSYRGDTKVIWSRDNEVEVEAARKQFEHFKKKGFAAFKVRGKDGEKGEQIHDFDPNVERIIFIPPMVGG